MWNFVKEPALTLLLVFAATTAVARPYYVPSGSMEPTIQIGDELLASKFAYGYSRYSVPFDLGPSSPTRLLQRMPQRTGCRRDASTPPPRPLARASTREPAASVPPPSLQ